MVIKAVIGANYGDEGKGLMTDYFCHEAIQNGTCLNVLTNGGSQRGHTVCADGIRHIFHHFGSGTIAGATTYIPQQFVCNPITMVAEWKDLNRKKIYPQVFVNPKAHVSTPYDMIYNMLVREQENKHNTCGYGIYETQKRNGKKFDFYFHCSRNDIKRELIKVRNDYYYFRMSETNIRLNPEWEELFYSEELLNHFIDDLETMRRSVHLYDDDILLDYDTVVFENGQGLLLDKDYDSEYGTSSNTGLKAVANILDNTSITEPIEACYVSRTYLTRHGDGNIEHECDLQLLDETNVYNEHQGHLRYGLLTITDLTHRIYADKCEHAHDKILAITHADEVKPTIMPERGYISYGKHREDITKIIYL